MFIQNHFFTITIAYSLIIITLIPIYHIVFKKYPENSTKFLLIVFMLLLFIFLTFAWYLKQNGMDIQIITVK